MKTWIKAHFLNYFFLYYRFRAWIRFMIISDENYVKNKFKKNFGIFPNLLAPKGFNEHISKILLMPPTALVEQCVDKYKVRQYVRDKVGSHILNENYGVYNNIEKIKIAWVTYPDRFVLKATHGCGWNYICQDKSRVDFKKLKPVLNHWLKSNFYYAQRERVYKNLKPGIIAEKYLEDISGGLIDYKIHCFFGVPKFINVIKQRFSNMKLNTYDLDWNFLDVNFDNHYPNDPEWIVEKPVNFNKMVEYSRLLSADFPYVRVDFYIVDGKIYFGELTFTPGNGAYTSFTEKEDLNFGSFLILKRVR